MQSLRSRLPGILATALMTAFVAFWTFWSFGELYCEGWGMPFPQPLAYLIPFAVALALGAAASAWPRLMGAGIIVASTAFYGWAISMNLGRWGFSWGLVLSWAGMASLTLAGGALFIVDGTTRARRGAEPNRRPAPWWRRRMRWLAVVGVPPVGLKTGRETGMRHATADDMARTGLCAYLNAEGTALMSEPQHIWRMPTADEYVRSLTRDGKAAGCAWNGERGRMKCSRQPDKETPLWNPDDPPIYMWTSEQSATDAWFVNYQAFVSHQPKGFGNPRHGYRCVKDPGR